jgi:hypothetical protein
MFLEVPLKENCLREQVKKNYNKIEEDTFASFSQNDIERLQQVHFESTGKHISNQETIEMGIRIKEFLRIVYRPIPEL